MTLLAGEVPWPWIGSTSSSILASQTRFMERLDAFRYTDRDPYSQLLSRNLREPYRSHRSEPSPGLQGSTAIERFEMRVSTPPRFTTEKLLGLCMVCMLFRFQMKKLL